MNWVPILVGAGAGVVAVLISTAVMKLLGKQESKGATVLYVVVFAIVLAIGREFATPQIQAMRAESALLEMPIYRALQKYEPQAYERILSAIERGIAKKLPQEQIWAVTRPVITEVSARRLPHASDDVLVQFAEHLVLTTNLLLGYQ